MSIENKRSESTIRERGFSALELVATLAVLALLLSAALPQLQGVIDRTRLNNEALALRLFLERTYVHVLTAREGLTIECE
jgi:prepilin-type N-terminal cleavage/methylation domain-containing protein